MKTSRFSTDVMSKTRFVVPLLMVGLLVLASNTGYSQKVKLGMSFGANLSFWRGDFGQFKNDLERGLDQEGLPVDFNTRPRLGINLGFTLQYRPTNWLILQPEVNYINEGTRLAGKGTVDGIDFGLKMSLNTNYIQVPVALKIVTKEGFFVATGPYAEFNTHSRMKVKVTAFGESDSQSEKLPNVNRFGYGFLLGTGFQGKGASFEIRYLNGMRPVLGQDRESYSFKNSVIECKVDILF